MLRFRIHFEHWDGTEESLVLSDETMEGLRDQIDTEMSLRNATYVWSEEIE